jgi:hypothetical protein
VGDDFEEAQRKMDALQEQQTQLLAQLRKQHGRAARSPTRASLRRTPRKQPSRSVAASS